MRHLLFIFFLMSGFLFPTAGKGQSPLHQKIEKLAGQQVQSKCSECIINIEIKWMPDALKKADVSTIKHIRFDEPGLPRSYQTAQVTGAGFSEKIQLFVAVKQKLLVANKRIDRGERITEADLEWYLKEITRMHSLPAIYSMDHLAGKTAGKMIRKGSVIFESDLQAAPVIKPGDDVTMIYSMGRMEVAIGCSAREAKAAGELIRLHSKETGRTYIGKVLTSEKVIWEKTL